jgi:hypothetical protein
MYCEVCNIFNFFYFIDQRKDEIFELIMKKVYSDFELPKPQKCVNESVYKLYQLSKNIGQLE